MRLLISFLLLLTSSVICLSQNILNVPLDFGSIQEAIDFSQNGDIILVAPGEYYENITIEDKEISVESHFANSNDIDLINQTKIIGQQEGDYNRVVDIQNTDYTAISGFYISGGTSTTTHANGIYIANSTVMVSSVHVANNQQPNTQSDGAGIHCHACNLELNNSYILNNHAGDYGGGVYGQNASIVNILNCQINLNNADISGGGFFIDSSSEGTITNSILNNNTAGADGGGVYTSASELIVSNSTISNNSANFYAGHGGGLSGWWDSQILLNNCIVRSNSSNTGGGVYVFNSNLSLNYCEISLNNAENDGGGVTLSSTMSGNNHVFSNCTFYDNTVSSTSNINSNGIKVAGGDQHNINIINTILWENISEINNEYVNVSYSNTQQNIQGYGNISQIASFISTDPSNPDYNLNCDSPCIDSGNPSPEYNDEKEQSMIWDVILQITVLLFL